jgi:hypothetical protein
MYRAMHDSDAGPSQTADSSTSKRGVKRVADESNDDQLRFTKRFNLLSLGESLQTCHSQHSLLTLATVDPRTSANRNSNYYIPVTPAPTNGAHIPSHDGLATTGQVDGDSMNVDDTRHRVYVQNLDAELAEIEANEPDERLIFLPDIEKHFSRLPEHIFSNPQDATRQQQELVLYSIPKSLTLDESQDSVRKAILEARQRARDKAAEEARHQEMERQYAKGDGDVVETAHGYGSGYEQPPDEDPDAMDIE